MSKVASFAFGIGGGSGNRTYEYPELFRNETADALIIQGSKDQGASGQYDSFGMWNSFSGANLVMAAENKNDTGTGLGDPPQQCHYISSFSGLVAFIEDGSLETIATLVSSDAGSFTLNWSASSSSDYDILVHAFFDLEDGITNIFQIPTAASTASQSIGFEPHLIFNFATRFGVGTTPVADYNMGFGIASNEASGPVNAAFTQRLDESFPTQQQFIQANDRCNFDIAANNGCSVSSFSSTGFTFSKVGSGRVWGSYMAIRFDDYTEYALREYTSPSSTGIDETVNYLPFEPEWVMLQLSGVSSGNLNTVVTTSEAESWALGSVWRKNSRGEVNSSTSVSKDNVNTTISASFLYGLQFVKALTSSGIDARFESWTDDGMQLDWVQLGETSKEGFYLAISNCGTHTTRIGINGIYRERLRE